MNYPTIESVIGNTPLIRLQRISAGTNTILLKLEGNNPAGSVKDRPALNMIKQAQEAGHIKPGDHLVEATSGNTGIALAMAAAIMGYKLTLIMPSNSTQERKDAMAAYGATLVEVTPEEGIEGARDLAIAMDQRGEAKILNQFANPNNPSAHYKSTGPEVWEQTNGTVTHFVSAMGTTGTIMGVSKYLTEQNPNIKIIGLQPEDGASIPGIRRWPAEYLPKIYEANRVDRVMDISQEEAVTMMKRLAVEEGILAGVSSGGAVAGALRLAQELDNAVIVTIICDRGDRYLSSGVFS